MYLTIMSVVLLVVGVVGCKVFDKYEAKWHSNIIIERSVSVTSVLAIIVGIFMLIACVGGIIGVRANYDVEYQNKLHEREVLEYRIERIEDDLTGNEQLYNDIVAFNNNLREIKAWADNPWLNWFYHQDIAELDYVELPTTDGEDKNE